MVSPVLIACQMGSWRSGLRALLDICLAIRELFGLMLSHLSLTLSSSALHACWGWGRSLGKDCKVGTGQVLREEALNHPGGHPLSVKGCSQAQLCEVLGLPFPNPTPTTTIAGV